MTDDQEPQRPRLFRARWGDMYATPHGALPAQGQPREIRLPDEARRHQLRVLRRALRAAAVAALDEAEWVRRARATGVAVSRVQDPEGVIVRYRAQWRDPRRADLGPAFLDRDLGRDLELAELRSGWPRTRAARAAAEVEWRQQWARFGQESIPVRDAALWGRAVSDAAVFEAGLARLPVFDRAGWAWAAARVAGVLAIWSCRAEPEPGALAAACEELADSSLVPGCRRPPVLTGGPAPDLRRAAYLLTRIRSGARDPVAERRLRSRLAAATRAIADAHRGRGEPGRAHRIRERVVPALDEPDLSSPRRRRLGVRTHACRPHTLSPWVSSAASSR